MNLTTKCPMTEPHKMGALPPKMATTTDAQQTEEGVIMAIKGVMMTVIERLYHAAVTMRPWKVLVVTPVTCVAKIATVPHENRKGEPKVIDSTMSSVATDQLVENTSRPRAVDDRENRANRDESRAVDPKVARKIPDKRRASRRSSSSDDDKADKDSRSGRQS
jgi:hypothetical protein